MFGNPLVAEVTGWLTVRHVFVVVNELQSLTTEVVDNQ